MAKVVLTGMRTTGPLHVGHKAGALDLWIEYQRQEVECFFLLADIQGAGTHNNDPIATKQAIRDAVLDWLAVGLDPTLRHINFVQQSQVRSRAELSMLIMTEGKYSELLSNPTLKTELPKKKQPSVAFLVYPLDEAADIMMVAQSPVQPGDRIIVPAGDDQEPMIELANDVCGRLNRQYGLLFPRVEIETSLVAPRLVGTDGAEKMSKSLGNVINLSDSPEVVTEKVRRMFTDPNRKRATDPGETVNNPVFKYHRTFNRNTEEVAELTYRYENGLVGDVEVKQRLATVINEMLDPIRQRRSELENEPLGDYIREGSKLAQQRCEIIVEELKSRMGLVVPD